MNAKNLTWLFILGVLILLPGPAWSDDETDDDENAESKALALKTSDLTPESDPQIGRFTFGSYGRVQINSDTEGHPGRSTNVVTHGPRIFEPSYGEIELAYKMDADDGFGSKVLFTLALFEPFAHYSGEYDQAFAVRNMYAECWGFVPHVPWLHLWAGSRMYRGDDIFLLDFWPLDNLNTIGGGLIFNWRFLDVRTHVGVNRLNDDYDFQTIKTPGAGYGAGETVLLDRQRVITSGKITYTQQNIYRTFGMKFSVYGEHHKLPDGEQVPPDLIEDKLPEYDPDMIVHDLPADSGWVAGGQVGFFSFGPYSHGNLFFRWAQDLAAYGETGVPFGTNNDNTAKGAYEMVTGLSANWEFKWAGCMAGGYLRKFKDADVNVYDTDDFMEGAIVARPVAYITEHLHQGFELSYQQHVPFGLEPASGDQQIPEVFQFSFLEMVSAGRGNYNRPQFRLTYTISKPNEAARNTYGYRDQRRMKSTDHYLGFGVEWWFNSSSY